MAKTATIKKNNLGYRISADQLITEFDNQSIITTTLSSDIALGGGIPSAGTVLIAAPPKAGKTTYVLQNCANAQTLFDKKVFFFPTEGRLKKQTMEQVRGLKTDIDHFEVVRPDAIFDSDGKLLGIKKWPAEEWWEAIGQCIEENPNSIIVLDSVSNMSPRSEVDEPMGKQDRGRKQQLESQFCRKYGELIISNNILFFCIAQIQSNTSGYGSPIQMKAGNSFKHQADIVLLAKKSEEAITVGDKRVGHYINFVVETSALGVPHVELKMPLRYGYGIDNIQDVLDYSIEFGFIEKNGAWFKFGLDMEDEEIKSLFEGEPDKFHGEASLRNWLSIHPKHVEFLESKVRKIALS